MFVPTFYLHGRHGVNAGRILLEQDAFAVMLATAAYEPADADAAVDVVQPLEARGENYVLGGVALPPMRVTVDVPTRAIRWGAGAPPVVFANVSIRDFRWAVGYKQGSGELLFYGDLAPQSVSGVDVTLAWHVNGIGLERVSG